ncbi:MAG: bifunctional tetrahydrofolate synthase/dihydrofolate synthase, partial [Sinobacterium sp.]|nr:bifunctional tetrahydrofolate synthase/dihydrofolate synthase [Sinobacterium sp.]
MLNNTLPEWLSYLEQQHSQLTGKTIDLGLDRVSTVAQSMHLLASNDHPASLKKSPHCQIITVAGTNGKGSFIASCEALLLAQGLTVGAYTSPHILQFNERIRLNGENISDAILLNAFQAIYEHCEACNISLSYFEFTTLAGLVCFQQENLDIILLEIGLGGRLDAVNIIEPDWAVITSIGLDHQNFLGDTLDNIAYEKCGILRKNTPLLLLDDQQLPHLLAAKKNRSCIVFNEDFKLEV